MADASNIGANFSSYEGNANLGGSTLGAFQLDTRPLQDFARYTMLYNREEQDRKQKEAEKAAEELAKIADYDLTTSIPKDAKILQEKYDKVINYVRDNPGATNFKNRKEWLEFQKLKGELSNDIRGAKIRNVMNMAREKQIADEKDENIKNFMRTELNKEIDAKDIRTPIFYTQEYDMSVPDFGLNKGQSLLVNRFLANQIVQDGYEIFDASEARRKGAAFAIGIDFDETTTTGKLKAEKLKSNFYVKGAEILNQAIANAQQQIDQSLSDADKEEQLKAKLSGIGIVKNIDALNKYLADTQARIKAGEYKGNNLNVADFTPINWKDGLSPEELAVVAQFSAWEGDTRNSKILQTNDAIERARIGAEYERIGIAKAQLAKSSTEDLISATAAIRNAADALESGTPTEFSWQGGTSRVKRIADPELMKLFSNVNIDGVQTKGIDDIIFDEKANKILLVSYKRKPDQTVVVENDDGSKTTTKVPGEYETTRNGGRIFETAPVEMTGRQWIDFIVRRENPNKDIGGVNALVETFFNSKGVDRKLSNLKKIYGATVEGTGTKKETESSSSTQKLTPEQEAFMKKYNIKQ